MDDVIIIGGSFAGLAAALTLGRARRQVTVLDTGLPRNRFAKAAHNLLGHDNKPPAQILEEARAQLAPYETVRLVTARAQTMAGRPDAFTVTTGDGSTLQSRRLLLAYGVTDQLPPIPGFRESWGKSVIHCPYCHGFEYAGQRWGLLYSGPMSLHMPTLYADWTDKLTVFTDGHEIAADERDKLDARGVAVVDGKVTAIEQTDGQVTAIQTDTGATTPLNALFAHPRIKPSADFHEQLGLATTETTLGHVLKVEDHQTSQPGIFAAGDLVTPMHSLNIALYTGSLAAVFAQRSMLT